MLPPYLPAPPQSVDRVVPASRSAEGPWSTFAPVPWTFNGAQPSQPSSESRLLRDHRSACGSRVHSFFRSERRLTPDPARFAPLEDYYSPSQPFYVFVCVILSIGLPKKCCQVFVAIRPNYGPKPSPPPIRPTPLAQPRPRQAKAASCDTGTSAGYRGRR